MLDVILKSSDAPDETSAFEKGKFEIENYVSRHFWAAEQYTRWSVSVGG